MRCLERSPTDRMLGLAVTVRMGFAALSTRPGGGGALMEPGAAPFGSRPHLRSRYDNKHEIVSSNPWILAEQTQIVGVAGRSSASTMDRVFEQAALWGLETEYRDAFGHLRTVDPKVLTRILEALAVGRGATERMLPRTVVIRGHGDQPVRLAAASGLPLRWEIVSEQKIAEGEGTSPLLVVPGALQNGIFRLRVTITDGQGSLAQNACLIVCRDRAYQGEQTAPRRMWALGVQLYGVRSLGNWGHGDFTDLAAFVDLAADLGAAGIGLNPLHALFDNRVSDATPYAPNISLFLNTLST